MYHINTSFPKALTVGVLELWERARWFSPEVGIMGKISLNYFLTWAMGFRGSHCHHMQHWFVFRF